MKVYKEMSIHDFEPWSGAVYAYNKISEAGELDALENLIDELYPDGIDETNLNDLLWFEDDWLLETLGISEEEEDEEEEDEEEEDEEEEEEEEEEDEE